MKIKTAFHPKERSMRVMNLRATVAIHGIQDSAQIDLIKKSGKAIFEFDGYKLNPSVELVEKEHSSSAFLGSILVLPTKRTSLKSPRLVDAYNRGARIQAGTGLCRR
jgi:hypothetical protein